MPGFEPGASASRTLRANQAAPHPVGRRSVASRVAVPQRCALRRARARRAPRRAPVAASSARQIEQVGQVRDRAGCRRSGEPSMREQWQPAAVATPTGAAESHSYWPPLCAYTSASPITTAIAFAPGRAERHELGVEHLGEVLGDRGRPGARHEQADLARAVPAARAAAVAVESNLSCPGSATVATLGMPLNASATCTAQSVRPSPHSRVPSSGSTIHTRSRVEALGRVLRLLRQHRVVGTRVGEPSEDQLVAEPIAFVLRRAWRACSSSRSSPASRAMSAASSWSSTQLRRQLVAGSSESSSSSSYGRGSGRAAASRPGAACRRRPASRA